MVEAVVVVGIGKVVQGLALAQDTVLGGPVQEHTQVNVTGKVLELGIQFEKSIHSFVTFLNSKYRKWMMDILTYLIIITKSGGSVKYQNV
jgi:hypothetical protein